MKKFYILLSTLFSLAILPAQTLISENFENYLLGNFGKQGGWEREGGDADQIKIIQIPNSSNGKSLLFQRTNTDNMTLQKPVPWSSRNPGNNILSVDFKLYSGTGFGETAVQILADGNLRYKVGELAYFASSASFIFRSQNMDPEGTITLSNIEENTWYNCKMAYNSSTGESYVMIEGAVYGPFSDATGKSPDRFLFKSDTFDGMHNLGYDNLTVTATNQILASTESDFTKTTVFPNPASDFVKVKSEKKIALISVLDQNGRNAAQSNSDLINISKLNSGIYLLQIKYTDGSVESKKIMKK